MSQTAIRMEMGVLEAFEQIMDKEKPDIVLRKKPILSYNLSTAIVEENCRAFKKFIAFYFLDSSLSLHD